MTINPYFTPTALTQHTIARAETVNAQFQAAADGFALLPDPTDLADGVFLFSADTGISANHYVLTPQEPILAYEVGQFFLFQPNFTSANGGSDINISGVGVKTLLRGDGTAIKANDILAGTMCLVAYDGANVRLISFHGSSEANAATSATAAAASATAALASQTAAANSASNAATSETNAAASATSASNSATSATSSATSATNSKNAAATSATNAATSETNAAASATAASGSATTASTQATNAAASATTATTQATNASNSATAAATSATNAAASATAAAASAVTAVAQAGNNRMVRLAATGNINIASPGATFDGVAGSNGNRILLPSQTTTTQNGIWIYNGAAAAMTRATDSASLGQTPSGLMVSVAEGSTLAGCTFVLTTADPITPGTTATAWSRRNNQDTSSLGSPTFIALTIKGLFDISNAAAGQIKFPATQNASADPNTLDDYEEGTFTPTLAIGGASTGVTYGAQVGSYTKIGNRVFFEVTVLLTSKGALIGNVTIAGLPFTAITSTAYHGTCVVSSFVMASGANYIVGDVASGTSVIALLNFGAGAAASVTNTLLNNTTQFNISGSYISA